MTLESSKSAHPKEKVTPDKKLSWQQLRSGVRAKQFDALLPCLPTSQELTLIARQLGIMTPIRNAIFDVDGTLVPPYAPASPQILARLATYHDDDRRTGLLTNSTHTPRLEEFVANGSLLSMTTQSKPARGAFTESCEQFDFNPAETVFFGNSAFTDKPLIRAGEKELFPLNILVKSIPPNWKKTPSVKQYVRARLFHAICLYGEWLVKKGNPKVLRTIPTVV